MNLEPIYFDPPLYAELASRESRPETVSAFERIKTGEFQLRTSHLVMMEIYHLLSLTYEGRDPKSPKVKIHARPPESELFQDVNERYDWIQSFFTSTDPGNINRIRREFNFIDEDDLISLARIQLEYSYRSGRKMHPKKLVLPHSKYMHLQIAAGAKCTKFVTWDRRVLSLREHMAHRQLMITHVREL